MVNDSKKTARPLQQQIPTLTTLQINEEVTLQTVSTTAKEATIFSEQIASSCPGRELCAAPGQQLIMTSADVNPERRKCVCFPRTLLAETIKCSLCFQLCKLCQRSFIKSILQICSCSATGIKQKLKRQGRVYYTR